MPRNRNKDPEQKTLETLKKHLKGGETLIIGVSGGADSVFLLNTLTKFKPKLNIIVAHLNHTLRGLDADLDTQFVKDLARKHDIECHCTKFDILHIAHTNKKSLEETGRDQRYAFFQKLYKDKKADFILTAHHSDDNLETILFNFTRGATLQGLSGMQEVSTNKIGTKFLRPLLTSSKQELVASLKKDHITYREDITNEDVTIPRNFLRHTIIPELKTLNPNLAQTILKNADNLREIQLFLEETANSWISKHNNSTPPSKLDTFDLKSFQTQHVALQKEILRQIYFQKEGTTKNIEKIHLEEVISVIQKNIGRKHKLLGKYKVEIKKGILIITS